MSGPAFNTDQGETPSAPSDLTSPANDLPSSSPLGASAAIAATSQTDPEPSSLPGVHEHANEDNVGNLESNSPPPDPPSAPSPSPSPLYQATTPPAYAVPPLSQRQHQQHPNLQDLSSYEQHLLQFQHSFHPHSHAQTVGVSHHQPTAADVLSAHHDTLSSLVGQAEQLHHQHPHQHHLHHQLDHSAHHSLASAIAAASSGSLMGDGIAGLAAHFQSAQHSLPSLPPPLPTFATSGLHHHHGMPHGTDEAEGVSRAAGLPVVGGSGSAEDPSSQGAGGYHHMQHQHQHPQHEHDVHQQSTTISAVPLYCLCQQPYDGASFMLACDNCNKWYHGKCVGIDEEEAKKGQRSGYLCPPCTKSGGDGGIGLGIGIGGAAGDDGGLPATTTTTTTIIGEKRMREEGDGEDEGADEGGGIAGASGDMMVAEGEVGVSGMGGGEVGGEPAKKRRKSQLHQRGERLCRFPGCDKKISCRSYCSRHQKQKERCCKRGIIFSTASSPRKNGSIGRPSKTFSQTRNQRQKLKRFDDKINDFAGGEQEGTVMLEKYLNSSYGQKRMPSTKGDKISQRIGHNAIQLVNQLPPTSPLRKPLIKALGQGLSQSEIADTFHVSRKTVERSFALPSEENLLFSLVSRPRGLKVKSQGGEGGPLDVQPDQLQQAGIYQQAAGQSAEQQLGVDLHDGGLPATFTVEEENGELSVSSQPSEATGLDAEEEGNGNNVEASVQTHVLLQGNVPVLMDTEDAAPLVFQGITS